MTPNELPKPLQTLLEISKRQVAKVNLTPSENTWQADKLSKIGGIGYLPIGESYPTNEQGEPLALLFQLNFEQLANEVDISKLAYELPNKGILQVYIGMNEYYGLDWDEWQNCYPSEKYQVRFWQNTELEYNNDELIKLKQYFTSFHNKYFDEYLPFNIHWQFLMNFTMSKQSCDLDTYDYDKFVKQSIPELMNLDSYEYCKQENIVDELKEYFNKISDPYAKLSNLNIHYILGYPNFTQYDPRKWSDDDCDFEGYICLLKIESEYHDDKETGIYWGDCGVANFFIHPNDLKNSDFSKLVYYWDCS